MYTYMYIEDCIMSYDIVLYHIIVDCLILLHYIVILLTTI